MWEKMTKSCCGSRSGARRTRWWTTRSTPPLPLPRMWASIPMRMGKAEEIGEAMTVGLEGETVLAATEQCGKAASGGAEGEAERKGAAGDEAA